MTIYPRYIEDQIIQALAHNPVVCIAGARQTGKTTLARQLESKRDYLNFDDQTLLYAAKEDPRGFVEGLGNSVILDEIQKVPELLPAIKMAVDEQRIKRKKQSGRFLLTGSANLYLLPKVNESLAGRMHVVTLYPLSELEKQKNKNYLLDNLLSGKIKPAIKTKPKKTTTIQNAICSGGYPEPVNLTKKRATTWYQQYLQAIIQRDIKDVANIRDTDEILRLLELISIRTSGLLNLSSIANELDNDRTTIEKYIGVLEKLFLVRRLPAWHSNKAKRLIKSSKIHIIDTGLATSLNNLGTKDWITNSKEFGFLLESFALQQLICQSTWLNRNLRFYHYRDKDQIEVDVVIEEGRNVWGVEIKRSSSVNQNDGKGLARLASQAGKNFKGGILLFNGDSILAIKSTPNTYAVPLNHLWS